MSPTKESPTLRLFFYTDSPWGSFETLFHECPGTRGPPRQSHLFLTYFRPSPKILDSTRRSTERHRPIRVSPGGSDLSRGTSEGRREIGVPVLPFPPIKGKGTVAVPSKMFSLGYRRVSFGRFPSDQVCLIWDLRKGTGFSSTRPTRDGKGIGVGV